MWIYCLIYVSCMVKWFECSPIWFTEFSLNLWSTRINRSTSVFWQKKCGRINMKSPLCFRFMHYWHKYFFPFPGRNCLPCLCHNIYYPKFKRGPTPKKSYPWNKPDDWKCGLKLHPNTQTPQNRNIFYFCMGSFVFIILLFGIFEGSNLKKTQILELFLVS
jgi:hypothetical protein